MTYDDASGTDFVILENNILDTQFLVPDLTPGLVYKFKIQARNSFGLSEYTDMLELTIGFVPNKPEVPDTVVIND